jgi:hypothetical protein
VKPIGETVRGLQGKKYLVESNGAKKAIPSPPSVKASKNPWDMVTREK